MKRYVWCLVTTAHSKTNRIIVSFAILLPVQWGAQAIWKLTESTPIAAVQRIQSEINWMLQSEFQSAAQLCQRSQRFFQLHPNPSD